MLQSPTTPGEYAYIPRADIPPANQTYCYRAWLHQVSIILQNADIPGEDVPPIIKHSATEPNYTGWVCIHTQGRCTPPPVIEPSATEPYDTRSVWSIEECMHTQAIGNLTYSDIGWSVFCSCLQKTSIMQDPESRQTTPQKHISWMNNWQVTQITYVALYKHENYFQSRPIHSYLSTSNLMYYDTKVLLSRNWQMYPPHIWWSRSVLC